MEAETTRYRTTGQEERATTLYERAQVQVKRLNGPNHPDTALALNNPGEQYKPAISLYERSLEIRKRVLGEKHPHTLTNMSNLADLYRIQGNIEGAGPLYERVLEKNR